MIFESSEATHKTEYSWSQVFLARLAIFGQLGLVSDPHINAQ